MLVLRDKTTGDLHNFSLVTTIENENKLVYSLDSLTYADLKLDFVLQHETQVIYEGFSVTVYLFKNPFYAQKDIVELRLSDENLDYNGRMGYFFRLDALFEPDILEMDKHNFTYAHYAVQYLFSQDNSIQTKDVDLTSSPKIVDFFDDDTIILVLCDQYTAQISNFSIDNYLSHLFLYGFTSFTKENPIEKKNLSPILGDNYLKTETLNRKRKHLKIPKANAHLIDEHFVRHLFKKLVQKENETVTRFIMFYQVIEILIDKVIKVEVMNKVCSQLESMSGRKIKEVLGEQSSEKKRISALLTTYARPPKVLDDHLKSLLLAFYIHINDLEFNDPTKHEELNLTDVFYGYRNKLVHNYRLMHDPVIDSNITESSMNDINVATEVLIAHLVTFFQ
ncbi:hypothetical protein B0A81_09960 [Flavobacterium plurextorum]|uniref:ApeA N-terminal domain-containing protein n=1 Tax=Flavobacterium plurextorum TaxID=1114867 RepID=A0ABX4CWN5_9FLAO|nr:hypothetical protein [Flavobacterium plurextorum]OXB08618.1 hypothetical protein B0A81_09960 [Flavobacterium plurextorum]